MFNETEQGNLFPTIQKLEINIPTTSFITLFIGTRVFETRYKFPLDHYCLWWRSGDQLESMAIDKIQCSPALDLCKINHLVAS